MRCIWVWMQKTSWVLHALLPPVRALGSGHAPLRGGRGLLRGREREMLFDGIAWVVWRAVAGPGASSGEGRRMHHFGHALLAWSSAGSWAAPTRTLSGTGRAAGRGTGQPAAAFPGRRSLGHLQPALEGDNHERDNGLLWVNRSWQPHFPWWK